jgi:HD-GYP domain-containing protein (c-di-GMP phosphodiesterase class II)
VKKQFPVSQYAVHTLDNQQLLRAGTVISPRIIEELIEAQSDPSPATVNLMNYGTVRPDLMQFISQKSYSIIFSDADRVAKVVDLMEGITLPEATLKILNYFKRNDFYTYRHFLLVYILSLLLAGDLITYSKDLLREARVGPTHDIGKICVPLSILMKTKPLTVTERRLLDHHALAGYTLLSFYLRDTETLAAIIARDHHERKDGSGYPRGIHLDNLMTEIVVASDVYDALISIRPYRPQTYDNRTALETLTSMAQKESLSQNVVQALVNYNRKKKTHYSECVVSLEKRGMPPEGNLYGVTATTEPPS